MRVVLDTNILFAAAGSATGASNLVLRYVAAGRLVPMATTAVFLEYADVLSRPLTAVQTKRTTDELMTFLDDIASQCVPVKVWWSFRPGVRDPKDEAVMEAAFNGMAECIVTHNVRDFVGAERFGVKIVTPGELLRSIV